jgi:hypothetical protein
VKTPAHRRMALLGAVLVLAGTFAGCQSTRSRTACAVSDQTACSETADHAAPHRSQGQNTPILRGESQALPPSVPEELTNRPALPPVPVERPQVRRFQGGPALNASPKELFDEDDGLDTEIDGDRDADAGANTDADEPIFPKRGLPPLRVPSHSGAAVNPPGRASLSRSRQVVETSAESHPVPRYPLPVTRRMSSSAAAPRAASVDTGARSLPLSTPVPLAEAPILLTPPTNRR